MTTKTSSAKYFTRDAKPWDDLYSGYFTEGLRQTAIRKAYLRPEMIVADIGAGTGFMGAGLAALVQQVYIFGASSAMLAEARHNLMQFDNLVFYEVNCLPLPLADASLDAIFANLYLHFCPDPLAAIQEMVRMLRPGGRLILTELDAYPQEWMRAEMADIWGEFERPQVRTWLEQIGLVNIVVDSAGQTCGAEEVNEDLADSDQDRAKVSPFIATATRRITAQAAVQDHYGAIAQSNASTGCCQPAEASPSCCGESQLFSMEAIDTIFVTDYSPGDRAAAPQGAIDISLGCGNPTALAGLQPGEVVLDIGSGGGIDIFLAARKVGPGGKAIGVDMTPSMLARAQKNAQKAGLDNVEFRYGHAEFLPVEDSSVDVIISNCVINLTEDKGRVFNETYRVLRPGGRLEISDMVTDQALPLAQRANPTNWGSCIFGALPEEEYLDLIKQAGFTDILVRRSPNKGEFEGTKIYSVTIEGKKGK